MIKTYSEKLLDPRWQKRRLEIFNRDNFTCKFCGATDKTLHVHHVEYFKDLQPWEYRDRYLKTLCCDCHELETKNRKGTEANAVSVLRQSDLSYEDVARLILIAVDQPETIKKFINDNYNPDC